MHIKRPHGLYFGIMMTFAVIIPLFFLLITRKLKKYRNA